MRFDRYALLLLYLMAVGAYLPARQMYDVVEEVASSWLAWATLTSPSYAITIANSAGWLIASSMWLVLFRWGLRKLRRVFNAAEQHERERLRQAAEYEKAVASGRNDPRPLRYGWYRS
jgi:hypothetical protein